MNSSNKIMIYHDYNALDIIDAVNFLLKKHKLVLDDISPENVEYCEFELKEIK